MKKLIPVAVVILLACAIGAYAQEEGAEGFDFSAGINLGTDVLPVPGEPGETSTFTRLGFQPEFSFGPFGIGLDLLLRFRLEIINGEMGLTIYEGDWIPDYMGNGKSFFDVYLPKFLYIRYGQKYVDPLYVKLGSIDDFTLGNGFIVGGYSNMRFLPEQRIFGLELGFDGTLVGFPYIGIEAMAGNIARFDVVGARIYTRPLAWLEVPVIQGLQVGFTFAGDTDPDLYTPTAAEAEPLWMYGADLLLPIIGGDAFPLAAFADIAFQPNESAGGMIGVGGKLLGVINYGAQLRILGPGFIPSYFDANYDLFRAKKYDYMSTVTPSGDIYAGWFAALGTSFGEAFIFSVSVDGPFAGIPGLPTDNPADYPHLRGILTVGEGLLGGFSFDFAYDKYFLGVNGDFWGDLISPYNAVIIAAVNYKTGAAVVTLLYNLKYNPNVPNLFDITSTLQVTMEF